MGAAPELLAKAIEKVPKPLGVPVGTVVLVAAAVAEITTFMEGSDQRRGFSSMWFFLAVTLGAAWVLVVLWQARRAYVRHVREQSEKGEQKTLPGVKGAKDVPKISVVYVRVASAILVVVLVASAGLTFGNWHYRYDRRGLLLRSLRRVGCSGTEANCVAFKLEIVAASNESKAFKVRARTDTGCPERLIRMFPVASSQGELNQSAAPQPQYLEWTVRGFGRPLRATFQFEMVVPAGAAPKCFEAGVVEAG